MSRPSSPLRRAAKRAEALAGAPGPEQQVCPSAGVAELSSRALELLHQTASAGTPSASAMGAALTGLLAVYWILQMTRALIWPTCICFGVLVVFAPMFLVRLLLEVAPSPILRSCQSAMATSQSSVASKEICTTDTSSQCLESDRSKQSDASLLLSDSYLLLPKLMAVPEPSFHQAPLIPLSALRSFTINPPPVHFGFPFHQHLPLRNDAAVISSNPVIEPEVRADCIVGHARVRNHETFYGSRDFNDFIRNRMDTPISYKVSELDFKYPQIQNIKNGIRHGHSPVPRSNTSITLSNFCLTAPTSARMLLDSSSSSSLDCLDSELSSDISLFYDDSNGKVICSERSHPIMGFFTPEMNSLILSSRVPGKNDLTLQNTISDNSLSMDTDNSSECHLLRIPSDNDTSIDTPSLTTISSAQNVPSSEYQCPGENNLEMLGNNSDSDDCI